MQLRTHLKIDQGLSGTPIEVGEGYAVVELKTKENMRADEKNWCMEVLSLALQTTAPCEAVLKIPYRDRPPSL